MTNIDNFLKINPIDFERSQSLTEVIRQSIIQQGGMVSFAHFMKLALYYPVLGYYNSQAFRTSGAGDFITAPNLSPLFAACFAQQCLAIMNQLKVYHILEIGGGSGQFAGDLLLTLEQISATSIHYSIYEISPYLRQQQQNHIHLTCPHLFKSVQWLNTLPASFNGIILANEVLDALPIHCFRIDHTAQERGVTWENNQFKWHCDLPLSKELTDEIVELQKNVNLPIGYQSEINLSLSPFLESIIQLLNKGVILLSDYGYGQREYYHPQRNQGTLTCFYQHHYHDNPLLFPGLQDITSHVDFTRVVDIAIDSGAHLAGFTTQASFLLACGLLNIAIEKEKSLNAAEVVKLHQAIKLLTLPSEMGECIKIMALTKEIEDLHLSGFSQLDRRRDL